MQSPRFPFRSQSPPLYDSVECACVAARHGSEWIPISGKAVLRSSPRVSQRTILDVTPFQGIIVVKTNERPEEVHHLVDQLRNSPIFGGRDKWANVRLTAKGAPPYSWRSPDVIESCNPRDWRREFTLCGNGPDLSSLLSYSTLQEIDSELRKRRPSHDGFDGLFAELGLPVRRSNLRSSFQLSAELPARFNRVECGPSKGCLDIRIGCLGAPDLTVEWLPQHELRKVPGGWIYKAHPEGHFVSLAVPSGATAANLILSFGDLQVEVSTVDLTLYSPRLFNDRIPLPWVPNEPTVPAFATREAPNQQKPAGFATREAPNQKLPKPYRSEIKRAILVQLTRKPQASDFEICRGLDAEHLIELPASWRKDGKYRSFIQAYKDPTLRHKIEIEISKVRADMRKVGIL